MKEIYLEENAVNMMREYYPSEPLSRLIDQIENGQEFEEQDVRKLPIT